MTSQTDNTNTLTIVDYSERGLVVRGDTEKFEEDLRELGGHLNLRLRGGPGYVFSKERHGDAVRQFVSRINSTDDSDDSDYSEDSNSSENNDNSERLTIVDYSNRALVVRGDTAVHKDRLEELGGFWNTGLRGGAGYVFSKNRHGDAVRQFVDTVNTAQTLVDISTCQANKPLQFVAVDENSIVVSGQNVQAYNVFFEELGGHPLPDGNWLVDSLTSGLAVQAFVKFVNHSFQSSSDYPVTPQAPRKRNRS